MLHEDTAYVCNLTFSGHCSVTHARDTCCMCAQRKCPYHDVVLSCVVLHGLNEYLMQDVHYHRIYIKVEVTSEYQPCRFFQPDQTETLLGMQSIDCSNCLSGCQYLQVPFICTCTIIYMHACAVVYFIKVPND